MMIDAETRRRLEGRVELLEGAPRRYEALAVMLAPHWFERLGELEFDEFAEFDRSVEEALGRLPAGLEALSGPVKKARALVQELTRLRAQERGDAGGSEWLGVLEQLAGVARGRFAHGATPLLSQGGGEVHPAPLLVRFLSWLQQPARDECGWRLFPLGLEVSQPKGPPIELPIAELELETDAEGAIARAAGREFRLRGAPPCLRTVAEFARAGLYADRDGAQGTFPVFDQVTTERDVAGAIMLTQRAAIFLPTPSVRGVLEHLLGTAPSFKAKPTEALEAMARWSNERVDEQVRAIPAALGVIRAEFADLTPVSPDRSLNEDEESGPRVRDYLVAHARGTFTFRLDLREYQRLRESL